MEDLVTYYNARRLDGGWSCETPHFLIWFDDGVLVIEMISNEINCWFRPFDINSPYFNCHQIALRYYQQHCKMRPSSLLELLVQTGISQQWVEDNIAQKRMEAETRKRQTEIAEKYNKKYEAEREKRLRRWYGNDW